MNRPTSRRHTYRRWRPGDPVVTLPPRQREMHRVYYVYLHKHPLTGEIMYVGKGKEGRAWTANSRRAEHYAAVKPFDMLDVVVIAHRGLSHIDAHRIEARLIHKHNPRFNIVRVTMKAA